jgi:hypothetical protein
VEFESPYLAVRIQHDAVVGFSRNEEISSLTQPGGLRRVRALCPCRTPRRPTPRSRPCDDGSSCSLWPWPQPAWPSPRSRPWPPGGPHPQGAPGPRGPPAGPERPRPGRPDLRLQRRRCLDPAGAGRRHPEGRHHGGPALCRADLAVGQGREQGGRPTRARASGRGPGSPALAGYPVAAAGDDRDRAWPVRAGRLHPAPEDQGRGGAGGCLPGGRLDGGAVHGHLQLLDARQPLTPNSARRTNRGVGPQLGHSRAINSGQQRSRVVKSNGGAASSIEHQGRPEPGPTRLHTAGRLRQVLGFRLTLEGRWGEAACR